MRIAELLTKFQAKFLELSLSVARKCIAVTWKADSPLLFTKWYSEMNSCYNTLSRPYN